MKICIIPLILFFSLYSMHEDEYELKRNHRPELHYQRLMEKINTIQNKINYIMFYAHDDRELLKDVDKLQDKLSKLQSKLQSHEND